MMKKYNWLIILNCMFIIFFVVINIVIINLYSNIFNNDKKLIVSVSTNEKNIEDNFINEIIYSNENETVLTVHKNYSYEDIKLILSNQNIIVKKLSITDLSNYYVKRYGGLLFIIFSLIIINIFIICTKIISKNIKEQIMELFTSLDIVNLESNILKSMLRKFIKNFLHPLLGYLGTNILGLIIFKCSYKIIILVMANAVFFFFIIFMLYTILTRYYINKYNNTVIIA